MIERVKDWYLTWRTGLDKTSRDYLEWEQGHIVPKANYVRNYFQGFKYVVPLDYEKVYTTSTPFWWEKIPNQDFLSYMWPNRPLGNNCSYRTFRGFWDQWDKQFHICDIRCEMDQLFVATNNEEDAIMFGLRWA